MGDNPDCAFVLVLGDSSLAALHTNSLQHVDATHIPAVVAICSNDDICLCQVNKAAGIMPTDSTFIYLSILLVPISATVTYKIYTETITRYVPSADKYHKIPNGLIRVNAHKEKVSKFSSNS